MSDRSNPRTTDMSEQPQTRTEEYSDANRSGDRTPEREFPASPLPFLRRLRDSFTAESGSERPENNRSSPDDGPSAERVHEHGEGPSPPSDETEGAICRYCGCPIDETAGCPARAQRGCEA